MGDDDAAMEWEEREEPPSDFAESDSDAYLHARETRDKSALVKASVDAGV